MAGAVNQYQHGETVVLIQPGRRVDRSGTEVEDWDHPVRTAFPKCPVWPTGSSEQNVPSAEQTITGYNLVLPPGTPVTDRDRIEVRGEVCNIVGIPFDWQNPYTGFRPGVEVQCNRRTG